MGSRFDLNVKPFDAYLELDDAFEWIDLESECEQVPLPAPDLPLVHWVAPAHTCKLKRNIDNTLRARPWSAITHVVIHSLFGHYANAFQRWKRGEACFKPHYVIRKDGEITQVVAEKHILFHANAVNDYSIGIEHDGFVNDLRYFTEEVYVASAALTRDICQRYNIPIDRSHIIGHDEAPGTGHGDPGGYWDWDYYLAGTVEWRSKPMVDPYCCGLQLI